ncbi:MAG TPA: Hpt domain-containing protein [Candidatus Binataceae bacterium]|nr:Hpt domain-containing protein [Candidatus Binataceae bacterium]
MGVTSGKSTGKGPAPIDLSTIEELADGDGAALNELIAMFKRHTIQAIARARLAIRAGQLRDAAQIAHTCIGFTATLGLTTMVPILRQLEQTARAQQLEKPRLKELTRVVQEWEREFARVESVLQARINRFSAP